MKNFLQFLTLLLSLATVLLIGSAHADPPNIVIIFTDDWGYGDLGIHNALDDVATPNLDRLARDGVLFTDGYITAPQCAPSRAGLMTGRYQQRFGFDSIPDGPLPLDQTTMADQLRSAGYVTGMVGKWHLEPNAICLGWARQHHPNSIKNGRVNVAREFALPYYPQNRGFDRYFFGQRKSYWSNFDLDGQDLNRRGERVTDQRFRVDVQTDAALAFIRRQGERPFLLYLGYYAPHVPLEATPKYLARFPGDIPERRRTGLAMMSAVDDGVGKIRNLLNEKGLANNTLMVFTSDNGAPLGAHQGKLMDDVLPVDKAGPAWDGSRNDPLTGEKGMLAEGGIRVPMIWSWPDRLPAGMIYREPMISLDITATALSASGVEAGDESDGMNILPHLTTDGSEPERDLFWRFWSQSAVRSGDWKLIRAGQNRELLFHISDDREERQNLIDQHPEIAARLKAKLAKWSQQLEPPGHPTREWNNQERGWFQHYFGQ